MFFEQLFLFIAILLYFFAIFFAIKIKKAVYCRYILLTGILSQLTAIIIRWIDIGHPPIFGTYEAALQGSFFMALFILFSYKSIYEHFKAMVITALPLTILIIFYGLAFNTERIPLTVSELNLWVDFHALFAWLAFGPLTLAFCLSAILLYKERKNGRIKNNLLSAILPQNDIIDELSFRYINFGFINHTIMFAMGCYYSSILQGTWWDWDPVESTSLITWLCIALYIHMRLFYNWKEKKAAWFMVFIFFTILISYWGLIYLPQGSTFHIFDLEYKGGHG